MSSKAATEVDALIGRRIVAGRHRLGYSQTGLAKALGITFQQVQKYEAGKNRVSAARLQRIAEVLELDVSTFSDAPLQSLDGKPLDAALAVQGAHDLLLAFAQLSPDVRKRIVALVSAMIADRA